MNRTFKIFGTLLILIQFLKWMDASATQASMKATHFHYPTLWKIINQSGSALYLECTTVTPGLPEPITMHSVLISSYAVATHSWGDGYYNDGLGMNPGNWTCSVGPESHPLQNPSLLKSYFSTTWGENCELLIAWEGEHWKVYKVAPAK